ncbi:MAG: CehA/McbA family metallohydrolase [Planctomycetes bacterium]|nr:CehA/McbA family metallohydrolase [Planctomycetota bacterium]
MRLLLSFLCFLVIDHTRLSAGEVLRISERVHLRSGETIEWAEFQTATTPSKTLQVTFDLASAPADATLRIDCRDAKQQWQVRVNDHVVGTLVPDENAQALYLDLPINCLRVGKNSLEIDTSAEESDDILVGPIVLLDRKREQLLTEAQLTISVLEEDPNKFLPARITIVNERGLLQPVGATSSDSQAVRAGVVYCKGTAVFGLPAGNYHVFASRGFEYNIVSEQVQVKAGSDSSLKFKLRREVDTTGYVSCDTHIHTREFSGHGDATAIERMLTIAGEGIELPVSTEHNKHISYEEVSKRLGLRRYYTPIVGNEFTTPVGHFNLFPMSPEVSPPDYRLKDWQTAFDRIKQSSLVQISILNHARDLHGGFRPFGPENFNAASARQLDDWTLRVNAMEVINSGALQTDMMQLVHDWMRLLNRGLSIVPIGSSDSHDVSRYIVGQARTYVRCDDENPGNIDIDKACDSIARGRVDVCFGLLCQLSINEAASGDTAKASSKYTVRVRVAGPSWVRARRVKIYRNGTLWQTEAIPLSSAMLGGRKFEKSFDIGELSFDQHLVAIAEGDTVDSLAWPVAKPYQPTSTEWDPMTMGVSGAVWIDADGDHQRTSALEYAGRLLSDSPSFDELFVRLKGRDRATIVMVADRLAQRGTSPLDSALQNHWKAADVGIRTAFREYTTAWRKSQQARVELGKSK